MTQQVTFRIGREEATLAIPDSATILQAHEPAPLAEPSAAVRAALSEPVGTAALAELTRTKNPASVAIVISDITRPVPNELLITPMLDVLNDAGVPDQAVTIIIATGMHRPSTPAERVSMLGEALLARCCVVDHQADDAESLVQVAENPPVFVNRHYQQADLKIVTGLIEPHFMAGFSGGRKSLCPGLVDLQTVRRFHGHSILADPAAKEGLLTGNPCHAEAMRVAGLIGCDFMINVAIDKQRRVVGVYAGDIIEAHAVGCRQVADFNSAEVDQPTDLVITSAGGYPLDETFYQSVKGMVMALPAVRKNGTLLIFSGCCQIGSPEYTDVMVRFGGDHKAFLKHIAEAPVTKDQWQYQMHARVLDHVGRENLLLACDALERQQQASLAVTPLDGDASAVQRAKVFLDRYLSENPQAKIAVIPEGPYTMLRRKA